MGDQYIKPYLDSSVFLGWVKNPPEIIDNVNRQEVGRYILKLAEQGKFKIYTSTLTIAEVYKLRGGPITPEKENGKILKYFESHFIEIIPVDRLIAEHANSLCRQHGIYPADAIHMATALRVECDVLLVWDKRFAKASHPRLRIEPPAILGQTEMPFGMPEKPPSKTT